jgi:Dyp-type peroxidase family
LLDYKNIQARVLPPVDFHFHIACFRRIVDVALARVSLLKLLPYITSAQTMIDAMPSATAERRELFLANVAFTSEGLAILNESLADFGEAAFREGLAARCRLIGTQRRGGTVSADEWKVVDGGDHRAAHLVLLVCGFTPSLVANKARVLCRSLVGTIEAGFAGDIRPGEEKGAYVEAPNDALREHFGFRDAISDPLKFDHRGVPRPKVMANQWAALSECEIADIDLSRFFCGPAAGGLTGGSYLVFLRLRQDVHAFHRFCAAASDWIEKETGWPISPRAVAEQIVGRDLEGRPLVPCAHPDLNQFMFDDNGASDPDGLLCPYSAHIRRVNPRDDLARDAKYANGASGQSLDDTARRLFLRRGMPYGPRSLSSFARPFRDDVDRGMHFIGIMASIEYQFEALMQFFVNSDGADTPSGARSFGVDGLIGANSEVSKDRKIALVARNAAGETRCLFANPSVISPHTDAWCWPTGGGYFFLPTLSGLRHLLNA